MNSVLETPAASAISALGVHAADQTTAGYPLPVGRRALDKQCTVELQELPLSVAWDRGRAGQLSKTSQRVQGKSIWSTRQSFGSVDKK